MSDARPPVPRIRPAVAADADRIGAVTEQAYRADGLLDVAGGEGYAASLRDPTERLRDALVLVAELTGEVVGTVTLVLPGSPMAEVATGDELEVRMLAVAASARRRGVGEALMAAALDHARQHGLAAVVLSTQLGGHARMLYERLGYHRLPERDWVVEGFELAAYRRPVDTAGR